MLAPTAAVNVTNEGENGMFSPKFSLNYSLTTVSDNVMIDTTRGEIEFSDSAVNGTMDIEGAPKFAPAKTSAEKRRGAKPQMRRVPIPPHRMTPLRNVWPKLYPPLVEHLLLQVRMNTKSRSVELRESKATKDPGALQKGMDFVQAFALGFDIDDAIALLRLDDLYIDTFEIKDVKTLQGDHLSRAIGRIAGQGGKTKFAIENASRTRIVLADSKIHILGGFTNIRIAKDAVVSLILGSPPGKVYANLRNAAARAKERI